MLPISEKFVDYAKQVEKELVNAGVRVEVDESNEKLGYKIRQCELQKVPYMLIVGEKEKQLAEETGDNNVTVRKRKKGGNKNLNDVLENNMFVKDFLKMTADDRKVVR